MTQTINIDTALEALEAGAGIARLDSNDSGLFIITDEKLRELLGPNLKPPVGKKKLTRGERKRRARQRELYRDHIREARRAARRRPDPTFWR